LVFAGLRAAPGETRKTKPVDDSTLISTPATDLFAAIASGDLDAKLIPQDSKSGTVVLTNTTNRPLTIKLPEAFAGIPVLAQRRGGAGAAGGGAGNNGAGRGGNQGLGGGFGGGGFGGGGVGGFGGGGGGLFNIGPERVTKVTITSVCLEHGKKEPNPRVSYTLVPLSSLTSDAAVMEVVKMLSRGEIDQPAAQAAAWHLANGLSWQQLVEKVGIKHISGQSEPYFTTAQIEQAQRISQEAQRRTSTEKSPGEVIESDE